MLNNANVNSIIILHFQFFITRIEDDISTAMRDHFRGVPDEFVTGPLGTERAIKSYKENQVTMNYKDQLESFINSLLKVIKYLEKLIHFGQDRPDDLSTISKELQNMGQLQTKTNFLSMNWAGSQENLMNFITEFAKIGTSWNDFAQDYDKDVIEPLKILQVC